MSNNGIFRLTALNGFTIGSTGGLLALTLPSLQQSLAAVCRPTIDTDRLVPQTVVLVCSTVLVTVAAWLSTSVLVCSLAHLGACPAAVRSRPLALFRPHVVRGLVAAALGAAVVANGGAAHGSRQPELPRALDGLALPDRQYGGVRFHRVSPGESLWSITAAHLRSPTDAAVAREWPRLHVLNRERIGADPHLIRPGTTLRLPTWGPARPEE